MSRRLILMRHAKSSLSSAGSIDHARPLNKRGQRDAPRVAAHLKSLGWSPDLVISSDATRTRETYRYICNGLDCDVPVSFQPTLYLGGLKEIRDAAKDLSDDIRTLLLLGHNPGWEEAASSLSSGSVFMTTANAALLTVEGLTWSDAFDPEVDWKLVAVIRPRELPD